MVAVSSEGAIPKEIDGFEIEVQRGDSTPFFHPYSLGGANPETGLPGTIALSNGDGEDASKPVTVIIRGTMGGTRRVLRQATLGFQEQKTKLLKMPLRYSCFDFPTVCPPGSSCKGGECAPDAVDVASLPDFTADQVFGEQGSSTCFDDRLTQCFASIHDVALAPLAAAPDCTVALGAVLTDGAGGAAGASTGAGPTDAGVGVEAGAGLWTRPR